MFEFKDLDVLTDGEIDLLIEEKCPENKEKNYVPAYKYKITLHDCDEKIGEIDIRIGYNDNLYYGGHIGYFVIEAYRGNHYASKACKIIKQVAVSHGMEKLYITCNPVNIPSKRTCERLGLDYKGLIELPIDNEMYQAGERQKCLFEWIL